MSRYRDLYKDQIVSGMIKKFGYKNVMEVPKLDKMSEALRPVKTNRCRQRLFLFHHERTERSAPARLSRIFIYYATAGHTSTHNTP